MEDFSFGFAGLELEDLGISAEIDIITEISSVASEDKCGSDPAQNVFLSSVETTPTTSPRSGMWGIFDGHGGDFCSSAACQFMPRGIYSFIHDKSINGIKLALSQAFKLMDDILVGEKTAKGSGCTALVVMIFEGTLYIANAGDSLAVLSRDGQAVSLNELHNPHLKPEADRIKAVGGQVKQGKGGILRVFNQVGAGGIAVTRSLGDSQYKDASCPLLSGEPDVNVYPLSATDEFLVIGSDGLWESMSPEDAVDYLHRENFRCPDKAADFLLKKALYLGSSDNISAIVVFLGSNLRLPASASLKSLSELDINASHQSSFA
eukprot:CAMPEP_0196576842 /NCGR_PEP_ID=MMETSP1081-20130531/6014_1 /TAXON_ID=36882 /ORGANISM="Pyramimonas amylifera, Strain CCMP720" /LENGTH=319 /DNA_ID=CAMNT_0041895559 /DNA_START=397 /DNA_END=1356 /DNA_ORIENTATION=-